MTKLMILVVFFLPAVVFAQNVAINNNGSLPHQSAMLDISSNTKGILIPRMTTLERTTISPPVIGLTVFDIDTYTYWVYRGDINGGWREMLMDFDKRWQLNGSHIYNLNNGNVGIGINDPQEKLSINAANPSIQLLNSNVAKGHLSLNNHDIKLGTYNNNSSGNLMLATKGIDRIHIDENGLVGIGTSSGTAALNLNGTNPSFQLRNGDVDKGFLKINSDDLTLGTNSGNLSGQLNFRTKDISRMIIDQNGDVGIGTINPSAKLEVATTNDGQVLKLNAADQTYMGIWENNGYRGYVGSYYGNIGDIDLGSLGGAVHLVTGTTIDLTAKSGKVGIGTQNPEQLLHVVGTGDAFMKIESGTGAQDEAGIEFERNRIYAPGQWKIVNNGNLNIRHHHTDMNLATDKFSFGPNWFVSLDEAGLGDNGSRWSTVYAINGTINTSDAREKSNITNLNYGLKEVMSLRPVSFTWINRPQDGTKIGLIAQEVQQVVKEAVVHGNLGQPKDESGNLLPTTDRYGIFYSDLIPVLIKATQEQQQMIEDLRKEIIEIKKLMEKR